MGSLSQYAVHYLATLMVGTTFLFALPIFIAPINWARLMLWRIPDDRDLAIYFGRCLGAFILIVELLMLRAVTMGNGVTYTFDVLFCVFGLMLLVHIYGAIRRIQPITETLEIGLWTVLLMLNTVFYPAPSVTL